MRALAQITVGRWNFSAELPAKKVPVTDKPVFAAADLRKLEQAAARWIVENGAKSPETLRYLRNLSGRKQNEVSALLGVKPETVSRWESGDNPFDLASWEAISSLALDRISGRSDTEDKLRAAIERRADGAREVSLELGAA
jgi:DNA-binding transcriptional regulator YiaG